MVDIDQQNTHSFLAFKTLGKQVINENACFSMRDLNKTLADKPSQISLSFCPNNVKHMQVAENLADNGIYSWVPAHYMIADWLAEYEHRQKELIAILKEIGATVFNDLDDGDRQIELSEIDPFTFFCYIGSMR